MKFKLSQTESIDLVYSFRSAIYFEQITNKNIDFQNFTGNDLITLFYCVVIASLQKVKRPIITMLDFMDKIDDYNRGDKCLLEFSNWYVEIIKAQYETLDSTVNEEKKPIGPQTETSKKKKA